MWFLLLPRLKKNSSALHGDLLSRNLMSKKGTGWFLEKRASEKVACPFLCGDLDQWLIYYNTERPHQEYRNQEKR
jgi:hypothetical protein